MKASRSIAVGALLTSAMLGAYPHAQSPSQLDRARIDQLAKEAAERFAAEQTPTTARPQPAIPGLPTGPTVNLTLEEAVRHAAENNLTLAVDRLNPQTFDLSLASLRSAYSPTLTSTVSTDSRTTLPTSTLNGGTRVVTDQQTFNGGLTQQVPWHGGSLGVSFNNFKSATNSSNSNFNPLYQSTFVANYTQPLLRGFKIDSTRQQLQTTEISRQSSEISLSGTTISTLSSVRNAYWDLVFATEAVDVARRSLALAEKLIEDNKVRVEVGTMAPIDIIQAESEAATRRQSLVTAMATLRTSELTLKRLIVSGTEDPLWRSALNPVDRPTFQTVAIDVETAVRNALDKRTDLQTSKNTLKSNEISLQFQHNQTLPDVSLTGTYTTQGAGGHQIIRVDPRAADSPIKEEINTNYFTALSVLRKLEYPRWTLGVNISYPIGRSSAEAQYARAKIQLEQARTQMKALELQIATDVTNAALNVQSNMERVAAAQTARELSEKKLEAEQSKLEVGMSTNYTVVQFQRDLRDAQNSELRALLDYRKSLVDFERIQLTGTGGVSSVSTSGGGGGGTATAATTGGGRGGGGGN